MTNWLFTTVVGAVFPAASTASLSGCFAVFAVATAVGTTILYFFQAENANVTSHQVDEVYSKQKP